VYLPILLAIPAALLAIALFFRDDFIAAFGITPNTGDRIIFSYSRTFPHWLINSFFFFFSFLALIAVIVGVVRFWRGMKAGDVHGRAAAPPARGVFASFLTVLRKAFTHEQFRQCGTAKARYLSHMAVFWGFIALSVVTLWVITCRVNPLIPDGFVYPFNFWSPWKILANLGGLAILFGGSVMLWDRLRADQPGGGTRYIDGWLLTTLLLVVLTGFLTEFLHYIRLEPHRHAAYFSHLAFIFTLIVYLPYSKFAHVVYRVTAMVYAEHIGREMPTEAPAQAEEEAK
jgi:quinone-modifying oxidoreductase subunit QmoC